MEDIGGQRDGAEREVAASLRESEREVGRYNAFGAHLRN